MFKKQQDLIANMNRYDTLPSLSKGTFLLTHPQVIKNEDLSTIHIKKIGSRKDIIPTTNINRNQAICGKIS